MLHGVAGKGSVAPLLVLAALISDQSLPLIVDLHVNSFGACLKNDSADLMGTVERREDLRGKW